MGKVRYFYKDKEISHLDFLQLMNQNGLMNGYRVSYWDHLEEMAKKGNENAISLLADMKRIILPANDFEPFIGRYR